MKIVTLRPSLLAKRIEKTNEIHLDTCPCIDLKSESTWDSANEFLLQNIFKIQVIDHYMDNHCNHKD